MGQRKGMVCFGWIARLMLCILLLPWGAYHGAGPGLGALLPETTVAMREANDSIRDVAPPVEAVTWVSQPRRCKTGVLLGTSCAPDAIDASVTRLALPNGSSLGRSAQTHGFAATPPETPPRRPPRTA